MGNFQKYWSQNVGQDFIVLDFFVGGISCGRKRCVREINVSHAWDPVHAGDKALRGRVNRYVYVFTFESVEYTHVVQQNKHCCVVLLLFYVFVIFILQGRSYFQKWFNFLRSRDVKGYVELHFCICITWTLVIICCRCCYK